MCGRCDDDGAIDDDGDCRWAGDGFMSAVASGDATDITSFLLGLLSKSMVSMGSVFVDLLDSMLLICILNKLVVFSFLSIKYSRFSVLLICYFLFFFFLFYCSFLLLVLNQSFNFLFHFDLLLLLLLIENDGELFGLICCCCCCCYFIVVV